jgi:hypothetical protein
MAWVPWVASVGLGAPFLADFADVFKIVVGVILSLGGLGLVLMGAIAIADKSWKPGAGAFAVGLALLVGGMWLVGVFG